MKIELGSKVRDAISGFEGVVVGRAEYLYGCVQCYVKAKASEGKSGDGAWLDEPGLELIERRAAAGPPVPSGGPQNAPPLSRH